MNVLFFKPEIEIPEPANQTDHQDEPANETDHQDEPSTQTDHQDEPANETDYQDVPATQTDHQDVPSTETDHQDEVSTETDQVELADIKEGPNVIFDCELCWFVSRDKFEMIDHLMTNHAMTRLEAVVMS